MYILILMMFLSSIVLCQTVEDGWKGIKPLRTSKAEVEKLLGKPEIDENGYHRYRTDEAFIRVNYSTTLCEEDKMGRGEYTVLENTVLDYYVVIKKLTKLSELNLKRKDYYRDTSGDVENNVLYVNHDKSIIISVHIQESIEYAGTIYYKPSKLDAEKFKCSQPAGHKTKKNGV